ncbi:MAG: NAD(P)H-binding protein [Anaerolineae bacterium]|nr:NAD(P)H-binding protein [Anaerolineae bacterium]MBT4309059.1 NAD(P)H-binding protein [Anaerolineae bacterium]MBT4460029.1 NAD(P)H-binding protein [Anaerolineae bacterium]MBT6059838.1 NAD(P)H-binding protein [Anaerolineae bacterium]MBT6324099.1 NAD(P)H-binding protein [Anaerolineae bacterium]
MTNFLIYGSYGYTGSLIAKLALKRGHHPILAGRDAKKLAAQAHALGLPSLAFDLSETEKLDSALHDVDVVLHCAGPFGYTYKVVADACLRTGTHYLDIGGGIPELEAVAALDSDAKSAGIMMMPGAGFDVVPSDCLLNYLKEKLPTASHLQLSIRGVGGGVSRGTARSGIENIDRQGAIRRGGKLTQVPPAWKIQDVDFGRGPVKVTSIGWGDVATAYHSTGVPNIETYMYFPPVVRNLMRASKYLGWLLYNRPAKNFIKALIGLLPPGPSTKQNEKGFSLLIGEARNEKGKEVRAKLRTPEAYYFTAQTSITIVERILANDFKVGFQTPSMAYGADFVLEFDGVMREDL